MLPFARVASSRWLPLLLAILLSLGQLPHPCAAQSADDLNEGLILAADPDTAGVYEFRFWARSGRTYFLQHSTDLTAPWTYLPEILTGTGVVAGYGFTSESPRVFVRLRHIDQTYADPYGFDSDGDGLTNQEEFDHNTDPFSTDTDGDDIDDKTELSLLILVAGDGWQYLRPDKADSDGNGRPDGQEDYDGDGLSILQELALGTDPNKRDTDTDGVNDGKELALGTDPLVDDHFALIDSDGDGLSDLEEIKLGTDRYSADTNGNGMADGQENDLGGDPVNPGDPPPIPPPGLPPASDHLPAPPSPPPPPPPPPPLPPASHRVLVRAASADHVKFGYSTYQDFTPPKRYLTETLNQDFSGGCPESGPLDVDGQKILTIDPANGEEAETGDDFVSGGGDIKSPIMRRGVLDLDDYDDPPNEKNDCPGKLTVSSALSAENTTQMLKDATMTKLPAYPTEGPDGGFRSDIAPYAYRILSYDELTYSYQRMEVKFSWPEGTPDEAKHPIHYVVVFSPEDDPSTTSLDESQNKELLTTWSWDGTGTESQTWTLDPDSLQTGSNGIFYIARVEFITPAGDPVSAPINATQTSFPAGANQYTYSDAASGLLRMEIKARIQMDLGALSAQSREKIKFTLDAIGESTLSWGASYPDGKSGVTGEYAYATATYTGLPQENSAFGRKKVQLKYDNQVLLTQDFEVFYDALAHNHPGGLPSDPNWFHYYKQNAGGGTYKYNDTLTDANAVALSGGGESSIEIGKKVFSAGNYYVTTTHINGKLKMTGTSEIYKYYAYFWGVIHHERQHAYNETPDGGGPQDPDADFLPSSFEIGTSMTKPNEKFSAGGDTYSDYFTDGEVYAGGPIQEQAILSADTSQDWACPGTNY